MGQAGTELRGQGMQGRLLPRLATRSQELGHLSRVGVNGPRPGGRARVCPGKGCPDSRVSTSSQSPSGSSSSSLGGRRQMKSGEADGGQRHTHTHRQRVHIAERPNGRHPDNVDRAYNGERQDAFFSLSLPFHMENRPTAGIPEIYTHIHTHIHRGVKHLL